MFQYSIVSALLVLGLSYLTAQDLIVNDSLLEEVVITHSRIPQLLKSTSKAIHVITEEDILLSGASDISQLLDQQIGITVNGANSNPALNKTAYIQGAAGEYVLYLIDGMPVTDPTSIGGSFDIRSLSLASIEKIEVLKGSQSTLYGSNAVSGVINIITKSNQEDGVVIHGDISYASYNSIQQIIGLNSRFGKIGINLSGNFDSSDGISEATDLSESGLYDLDGYQRRNINADLIYQPSQDIEIRPFIRLGDYSGAYDAGGFTDSRDRYTTDYLNAGTSMHINKKHWSGHINYSYTETDRLFITSFGDDPYDGRHHSIDAFSDFQITSHQNILIGTNFQSFSMTDDFATVNNPQDDIWSAYVNYRLSPTDRWNLELGTRYNIHSRYGSNLNYEASTSYWISDQIKWNASYSTGFKAPLLPQLYGPFGANPDLLPQKSKYWQSGLSYQGDLDKLQLTINYFNRSVDDIIIYYQSLESRYLNFNQQNDQGIEASIRVAPCAKLNFSAGYTFLTGKTSIDNVNGVEVISDILLRRPKHELTMGINFQSNNKWILSYNMMYRGNRNDLFFNFNTFENDAVVLDSYLIAQVQLHHQVDDSLEAYLTIGNLFNTNYSELQGYSTLKRTLQIGMRFKI